MPEVTPIGGATPSASPSTQDQATKAFGLGFEDLLRIVLTQLTYQDPLKPMESYEFVSQLAQFSQIQQSQTANDRLTSLLASAATAQATGLLGRVVEVPAGGSTLTGKVKSIAFQSGEPILTIETTDNRTLSGIALSSLSKIALEN